MSLVQKLPIGLGLACLIMMSSCSKEDSLAPQPGVLTENSEANARYGVMVKLPFLAPTIGPVGYDVYPEHWERRMSPAMDPSLSAFPSGTSSLTHLWGDPAKAWETPLPGIPFIYGMNSIVTVATKAANGFDNYDRAFVQTKISNLQPFTKYTVDYYVATSKLNGPKNSYANWVEVSTSKVNFLFAGQFENSNWHDLSLIPGLWKKGTLEFDSKDDTEVMLGFSAESSDGQKMAYAHIFVDKHSIKKKI